MTFQKYNAEETMNFFMDLFEDSKIIDIQRWANEGTIMLDSFELNRMKFIVSDSPTIHNRTFTPAVAFMLNLKIRKR